MSQDSVYDVLLLNAAVRRPDNHPDCSTAVTTRQRLQVSMSILNTRLRRCAQVIAAWRPAGDLTSGVERGITVLPRLAGVTAPRQRWFGARTPWYLVRLTLGLGTRDANRAMKSTGSKAT